MPTRFPVARGRGRWGWGAPHPHALIGVVLLAACGDPLIDRVQSSAETTGALTVHTVYALPPFTDAPMPVYLTIDNTAAIPDSLLEVRSAVSARVMLHGGGMEGLHALVVPAGGSLVLRPGETHLMLEPPLPTFVRGDSLQVTLRFAHAGELSAWARVIDYNDLDRMR
jgi:copper(I)-binding protein